MQHSDRGERKIRLHGVSVLVTALITLIVLTALVGIIATAFAHGG